MTRIVDLSFDLSGRYAARLLADNGDEVIGVELPETSDAYAAARWGGLASVDLNALREHLGRNKSVVTLDYGEAAGRRELTGLISTADVLIHTYPPSLARRFGLDPDNLKTENPDLTLVTITAHGYSAPDADEPATEKTLHAESGATLISGDPDGPFPLSPNVPIVSPIGALYGAISILAHRMAARRGAPTGFDHIDVAIRDLMPVNLERVMAFYTYMKVIPYRGGRRERMNQAAAMGDFNARDGGYHIFAQHDPFAKVAELIGRPDLAQDEQWLNPHKGTMAPEAIRQVVADAVATMTVAELETRSRNLGIPAGPVREVDELETLPQIRFRKALTRGGDGLEIEEPFRFSHFERPRGPRKDLANLADLPPKAPAQAGTAHGQAPAGRAPLSGVRVLDLTHAYAGPSSTRILAELGAEVIKVESVTHLDGIPRGLLPFDNEPTDRWWERSGYFAERNLGKKDVTLDMGSAKGREIFTALLPKVDVVATNFRPRVMKGWGLAPDQLLELNPDLVVLSISGFGGAGPDSEKPALAGLIEATSGFTAMVRYSDRDHPTDVGFSFGDMISGLFSAFSTLAALDRRDRTGRGDAIDLSCCEAPLPLLATQLQQWARTGHRPSTQDEIVTGGRHLMIRTTADDTPERWVMAFIRPAQEEEAERLFGPRPETALELPRRQAELVRDLRSRGFIAAPLTNAEELVFSEVLNARQLFEVVDRPSVGPLPHASAFPVLENSRPMRRRDLRPPPALGQDSAAVFHDLLGVNAAQYDDWVADQLTGTEPVGKPHSFMRWPIRLDELIRRGRMRPVPGAAQRMAQAFGYTPQTERAKHPERAG